MTRSLALLSLAIPLAACSGSESNVPEGALYYDVTVTGTSDGCHTAEQGVTYQESFTYAVSLDGSDASLYVDGELFGTGILAGCALEYETVVLEQARDGGILRWQLSGQASFDRGDDQCVPTENDWEGTEVFTIVDSEDPAITQGCEYQMSTAGAYQADGAAE